MDLGKRVDYERLFDLELRDPITDEPLGVIWTIRSSESDAAKKVLRKHLDENTERRQKGKLVRFGTIEQQELEKAAALIASWNWGEHTYNGVTPVLSMETAVQILDREGWMYGQLKGAADSLANFTPTPAKASAAPQG